LTIVSSADTVGFRARVRGFQVDPNARPALQRRSTAYGLVLGTVMGMLLAGLAFPLAFGSRTPTTFDTAGPGGPAATAGPEDLAGDDLRGGNDAGPTARTGRGVGPGGPVDQPRTPDQAKPPPGTKLTASDVGVTPDSIKVGVLIGDAAEGASQVGLVIPSDVDAEKKAWEAYIADLNARGGIFTRKLKAVYRTFSAFDDEDAHAKCLELTKDEKVFAVLNASWMYGNRPLCYTKDARTPLFSRWLGAIDRIYAESKGYLAGSFPSHNRVAKNLAYDATKAGLLKGKRVGVLVGENENGMGREDLVATLKSLKANIVHISVLPPGDGSQAAIPGEVQQMKTKRVQVLLMATFWIDHTAFVQTAQAQLFRPQYVVSDIDEASDDIATQGMPQSYEGAIAFTFKRGGEFRAGVPESAVDKACVATYEKRTGEKVPRSERGYELDACDIVTRFERAGVLAGPTLTRDALSSGIQKTGEIGIPYTAGGSYGPGKFDGADFVRTKRFKFSCTCYEIVGGFHRAKY
jgi:ABC-type branched-subunit amino acid transport system substrate-binding protein